MNGVFIVKSILYFIISTVQLRISILNRDVYWYIIIYVTMNLISFLYLLSVIFRFKKLYNKNLNIINLLLSVVMLFLNCIYSIINMEIYDDHYRNFYLILTNSFLITIILTFYLCFISSIMNIKEDKNRISGMVVGFVFTKRGKIIYQNIYNFVIEGLENIR